QLAVGGERDRADEPLEPFEPAHLLAGRRVPQADHLVGARRGQELAVGREGDAAAAPFVPAEEAVPLAQPERGRGVFRGRPRQGQTQGQGQTGGEQPCTHANLRRRRDRRAASQSRILRQGRVVQNQGVSLRRRSPPAVSRWPPGKFLLAGRTPAGIVSSKKTVAPAPPPPARGTLAANPSPPPPPSRPTPPPPAP